MTAEALTLQIGWVLLFSMAATALLAALLIPLARRIGWMDQPDARKVHSQATPLVGGVAIFFTFFGVCLWLQGPLAAYGVDLPLVPLFVASLIVLLTGLVDDKQPLSSTLRFIAQGTACLVMIYWGGIRLTDFGSLFWTPVLELGLLSVPITLFAALGVINAFNMIDGLDGLSGSLFIVAALSMVLAAFGTSRADTLLLLLLMAACVAGFVLLNARFPWNVRARTFLGDSGSVLLGFWLSWMLISLGNDQGNEARAFAPMTAVWILGVPLLDTTRLMRERWKAGKSAFDADRTHLHHAFMAKGLSVSMACGRVVMLSASFGMAGVVLELLDVPEYVSFYAFVGVGVMYLMVMKRLWLRLGADEPSSAVTTR